MAISELQIALIGAGVAAVGAVWAYNVWQDRRHRETADRIFKGAQGDPLPGSQDAGSPPEVPAESQSEDGGRREPHLADATNDAMPGPAGAASAAAEAQPASPAQAAPPGGGGGRAP